MDKKRTTLVSKSAGNLVFGNLSFQFTVEERPIELLFCVDGILEFFDIPRPEVVTSSLGGGSWVKSVVIPNIWMRLSTRRFAESYRFQPEASMGIRLTTPSKATFVCNIYANTYLGLAHLYSAHGMRYLGFEYQE